MQVSERETLSLSFVLSLSLSLVRCLSDTRSLPPLSLTFCSLSHATHISCIVLLTHRPLSLVVSLTHSLCYSLLLSLSFSPSRDLSLSLSLCPLLTRRCLSPSHLSLSLLVTFSHLFSRFHSRSQTRSLSHSSHPLSLLVLSL